MKILITSDSYFPRMGGAEVYAYKLGHFLQKEGNEVSFCVTEPGEDIRDKEFSSVNRLTFYKHNLIGILRSFFILWKLLRQVDVVHCVYSHKLAAVVGVMRFFIKVPQVISLEGRGILDLPNNDFFYKQIHSFYRWISLKRASLIIASCNEFVVIASRYVKDNKIKYQPNSVDVTEFNLIDKNYNLLPFEYKNQKIVTTIRRLVPKNGIQFLVETIPYVIKDFKNVKFILIGWGGLEKYLKNRVKELFIDKYVYFLGRIDNKELPSYLNLSDMVIFPSTAESTSVACLESMSLSKPIIASKVGGYLEMVKDDYNGFLVNLTDNECSDYDAPMKISEDKTQEFANKILSLLKSEEKQKTFGQNSRKMAEDKFSWHTNIKTILDWYNEIK